MLARNENIRTEIFCLSIDVQARSKIINPVKGIKNRDTMGWLRNAAQSVTIRAPE